MQISIKYMYYTTYRIISNSQEIFHFFFIKDTRSESNLTFTSFHIIAFFTFSMCRCSYTVPRFPMNHAGQDFPIRSRQSKSTIRNEKRPIPSAVANPVSHEPLRRTGSFAAATITAALAIWATTGSNILQSLLLSLSYAIHQTLRSSRWSTMHRKQLYQRSPAHSAPHAPSPPPSRAPPPPSRRPRTTRHPPASATTTPMISGRITQRACASRSCRKPSKKTWPIMPSDRNNSNVSSKRRQSRDANSTSEARRRRRHQNGPRRRRRRRRECHPRRSSSVTAAVPPAPFPLPRRCRRRLSRWSWQPQRSRSPIYPRAFPRKSASWSAAVARTAGNLFLTAPLEGRGSRGR